MSRSAALEDLESKRASGEISKDCTDEHLGAAATNEGYHAQAVYIAHHGLTVGQFNEFDQHMNAAQHPNGASWTEKYGNMQTYSGTQAAQQRARNTHLSDPSSLHDRAVLASSNLQSTAATNSSTSASSNLYATHGSSGEEGDYFDDSEIQQAVHDSLLDCDVPMDSTARGTELAA